MDDMKDRLLFYGGLKEKVQRTEEDHRDYIQEGMEVDNHFSFGLYEFRGLLEPLYARGDTSKLADYFEIWGTTNRSLYRDHEKKFWWIYPSLVWLLCSSFYHYRSGRFVHAANLARLNYAYMEELRGGFTHGFTSTPIGDTERGMFEELMGYFSLLFDPSRFESHMSEAKRMIEEHTKRCKDLYAQATEDDEEFLDSLGIDEQTITSEFTYDEAHQPFDISLILCFDINVRTYRFAERELIFDRLKTLFTTPPNWDDMRKPSFRFDHMHLDPYQ
ncbi:hypothetical protein FHS18_002126 [Paenibacillus phyllosphaerae]|uniref:Uncharacterized protein n=1 Tax=Paenibacillus phyllosphaerae TaxID=274593 RepID=A0A7W5AWE8_9BACL|nr:hypothetical protein [Paenibacillus phyllosphaerae]MBB3110059.1 hypothetical protein [Paenibacillus phyllosphaerae]